MKRLIRILAVCTIVAISLLALPSWVASEVGPGALALCSDVAFSTRRTSSPEDRCRRMGTRSFRTAIC